MELNRLERMLSDVRDGRLSVEEGMAALRQLPFEEIGCACIDHHRRLRKGFPEVIYSPGKSCEQLVEIIRAIIRDGGPLLATRVTGEQAAYASEKIPELEFHPV